MDELAENRRSRLAHVRQVYRILVWFYDPIRALWSRLTSRVEGRLDQLFRERVGPHTRILELGPGTGVNLLRLRRVAPHFASYLGIDASDAMLARARRKLGDDPRIELRLGNVTDLSMASGPFDFVVSTWLLSHLEKPERTVQDAVERLAEGGTAVFVFSTLPRRWLARMLLAPFYRLAAARLVDPGPLAALPGLERLETSCGGLATLAVFRRASRRGEPS